MGSLIFNGANFTLGLAAIHGRADLWMAGETGDTTGSDGASIT
ncbi:MAG: hypothetical protein WBY44_24625 [Bryobacteraceae bacterium]